MKLVGRVDQAYPLGFFLTAFTAALRWAKHHLSLGRWVSKRLSKDVERSDLKVPAFLADTYITIWLVAGLFLVLKWPLGGPASDLAKIAAAALLLYRAFELSVMLLAWVFLDSDGVHSYRRSVILFMLNGVEVAVIATAIQRWWLCHGPGDPSVWQNFADVMKVENTQFGVGAVCSAVTGVRFLLSVVLMLVVVATLTGGLIRDEVKREV